NSGNTIYYSTNGKNPTKKSKVYKKKLAAKSKVNIIALEYNKSGKLVASINIVLMPKVKSPVFSLSTDSAGNKYVTITSATSGAKIYYTTDGSTPTEKSNLYTGKIAYKTGSTLKARAFKKNMTKSSTVSFKRGTSYDNDNTDSNSNSGSGDDDNSSYEFTEEAKEILRLVNIERTSRGLHPLTLDPSLCKLAQIRADEQRQLYDHVRPDGSKFYSIFSEYKVRYSNCAENLARGQKSAEETVIKWMNSSAHKANILNSDFYKLGVGYITYNGDMYRVQLFSD
ncbi:MAG: chitobiase/beta-hexosaminidase C-terminal domain-containing protein, partial [Ruminiclostridium sp.]|nr:chitobiase/beta-hexosaminidase C-terminal domain-containing protein [Ruminiclostridium sp.]